MEYLAKLSQEGRKWLVEFPDCPGCQTFGRTRAEALSMATEALEGWLEAHLVTGKAPPRPRAKRGVGVHVAPSLGVVLQLRWQREDRDLTQAEVARLAGVSQQAIAKVENPDGNPTLATIAKVAAALGLKVDVQLTAA
jgi:predicted RNase H-like HicB family nuclease/DNA-binding XRE family transcriptional regulator